MKYRLLFKIILLRGVKLLLIRTAISPAIVPLVLILTGTLGYGESLSFDHAIRMELNGKKLTALIEGAPLKQVIEQFSNSAEVKVVWQGGKTTRKVWARLKDLPIAEAFKRILKGENCAFFFSSLGGRYALDKIVILPSAKEREMPASDTKTTPEASMSVKTNTSLEEVEKLPEMVMLDDETRDWIASVNAVFLQYNREKGEEMLVSALTSNPDPQVRRLALEGLSLLDPESLDVIIDTAINDPEPDLRMMAAEYLKIRKDEDPRIKEIVTDVTERDYHFPQGEQGETRDEKP